MRRRGGGDGETGAPVDRDDVAALAAALERYLTDRSLRARHGAAACDRTLADYRPDRLWDAYEAVYARRTPALT